MSTSCNKFWLCLAKKRKKKSKIKQITISILKPIKPGFSKEEFIKNFRKKYLFRT